MFKVKWDKNNNGIILTNKLNDRDIINPPRPVYNSELDLFGFNKYWDYERDTRPLLWAIGRNYFYKGNMVASLKGGDIYNEPEIDFVNNISLSPINIDNLIDRNHKALIVLENESKKFINKIYLKNKKTHTIGVAFSGGKDSQVILDLVTQVIPPSDFFSIFTDTQMELPSTYDTIKHTINYYRKKYYKFDISIAKQYRPILDNWNDFGTPSRLQRWCCSVCKTAPYLSLIRKLNPRNFPVIVYEGVRAEESTRRMTYERVAYGEKHKIITSARPIFYWNISEVYMYLLYRNIDINPAYKYGLSRVGCIVCPFSSEWSEYIVNSLHPQETQKFINSILKSLYIIGIKDKEKQIEYIRQGHWKKRAGGKSLIPLDCSCDIVDTEENFEAEIINPESNLFEWFKILKARIKTINNYTFICDINYGSNYFNITINVTSEGYQLVSSKKSMDQKFISILKKIVYKTTYCKKCGVCLAECPNNAISFDPHFEINQDKCANCLNCITFVDNGCLLAKSRYGIIGGNIMNKNKINLDRYSTFGLREEWLTNYFITPTEWKKGLGSKQIPAFRRWILEAQLINDKNRPEKLFYLLNGKSMELIWSILWINLCGNSPIAKWYSDLQFKYWERNQLNDRIFSMYPQYAEGTLKNPVNALLNTFDNSTYFYDKLKLGVLNKKGRTILSVEKRGSNEVHPIAILYCLYKYAEKNEYYDLTLSELYREDAELTPYRIFGIEKQALANILRGLQENKYKFIHVEFAANLDNIFLNKEYTVLEVLEIMLEDTVR